MQHDSLDRDFQTFRANRDPAALAAVFDAAAPRLLLVAMHLCRDAATAEDLVQTVFLQVLRDADRFDPRRPVMPWLLGMLEHRASDQRQRAHVRREQLADATAVAGGPSPERAAAANEVRDRVAEALAGMPRDYRDVLTLRLVHGLSAVDIGHAHGLQPATVRTRLRRGLELLRGALPRGLATHGLLALLAAELVIARDGLAAVRTKVLTAAAAGSAATFAFGWWLVLAACVVLATGGWMWFAPPLDAPSPLRSEAAAAVVADAGNSTQQPRKSEPAGDAQRTAATLRDAPDPDVTTVRGRVLDATTGTPMAGVVATLKTYAWQGGELEADWRDPDPVTTAADGTFAVKFVPSRHRHVEVGFTTPGFVDEFTYFEPLRTGVDVDAGDVRLQPGTPVHLRLSCNGVPLGGVETWASRAPDSARPEGDKGHGVSDRDGVVDLGMCMPGTWSHDLRTYHLGHEARFDVPLQRDLLVVTIDLREPPADRSISGQLADTSGAPVAGVELRMPWPGGGHLTTTTRTDGRFLWARSDPPLEAGRERIELPPDRRDLQWVDDGGPIAWGTHTLRLVVRHRAHATLRLEVIDAATQQPVEAFGASCRDLLGSGPAERRLVAIEPHPGGVATFELAPGAWYASVFAGESLAESAELPVQLAEGSTTTLRVSLRPPAELIVDVVDAVTNAPLEGVELALMKAVPAERARDFEPEWYEMLFAQPDTTGSHGKGGVLVLARAATDAHGRARVRAPGDVPGLVLVAGGPRCATSLHHDIVLPACGATTTLRVASAAIVRGVVTPREFVERFGPTPEELAEAAAKARAAWTDPAEFADRYPRVVLQAADGETELRAHVAADGTFTIGGVPAGKYAVSVEDVLGNCWTDLGRCASVDVNPAQTPPPLTLDVSALVPARGKVRYFVDGSPACGEGGLARLSDAGLSRQTFPLAADGSASTPWLLPGTYVPFVVRGGDEHVFGTECLNVSASGSIDATFALQRRAVTISIVETTGEPARDVFVWIEAIDPPSLGRCWWLPHRTDAGGHLVLTAAPPGRMRLRAFARDQDLRDTTVEPALLLGEVAADANAATFRLPR